MNRKYLIFTSIIIIICLSTSVFAYQLGSINGAPQTVDRYSEGFEVGKAVGDSDGYTRGYSAGSSSGYNNGYTDGLAAAPKPSQAPDRYNEGYDAGVVSGKNQGYNDGYSKGTSDGFNSGYSVGYINGTKDGAGTGYNIRDPTYNEMINFITVDQTDKNVYTPSTYTCFHFSQDVLANAFNRGIKAGLVYIEFTDSAHAIIAFNTTDKGLIYIEPQTDIQETLQIGQTYSNTQYIIKNYVIIW